MTQKPLTLRPDLTDRLRRKAAALGREPEELLDSVVKRYLADDSAYLRALRGGFQDLEEGRVVDFEDVRRCLRKRLKPR